MMAVVAAKAKGEHSKSVAVVLLNFVSVHKSIAMTADASSTDRTWAYALGQACQAKTMQDKAHWEDCWLLGKACWVACWEVDPACQAKAKTEQTVDNWYFWSHLYFINTNMNNWEIKQNISEKLK